MVENDTHSPGGWAQVGGLWTLAGRPDLARDPLRRAAGHRGTWTPHPHGIAGVRFLLGDHRRAAEVGAGTPAGALAQAARTRDPGVIAPARAAAVKAAILTGGPHETHTGVPLTPWDWIEESFRLEAELTGTPVPSHRGMLERCGVLGGDDGAAPDPALAAPPRPGVRIELPSGTWLDVASEREVRTYLGAEHWLDLRLADALWGAYLTHDPQSSGEWVLGPAYASWKEAAAWVADQLEVTGHAGAAATLRDLVAAYGGPQVGVLGPAREPVPDPPLHAPPRAVLPSGAELEVDDDRVHIDLDEGCYVELRLREGAWTAHRAPERWEAVTPMGEERFAGWPDAAEHAAATLEGAGQPGRAATLRALVARVA